MSGDDVLIQDAMGEKVGKFIQLISTFIGGFIIAFIKSHFCFLSSASLTGEKQAIANYEKFLASAYKSGVQEGMATGSILQTLMFVFFGVYALAICFGSKLIRENGNDGGVVTNVLIAILTGSMSLGQGSPCLSAFAAGQAAAFKMFETIKRKPEIDGYDSKGKKLDDIRGDIEFREAHFSYPARPDEQILRK